MTNARFSILQARAVSDARISNAQFRTLAALGIYADKDGVCFPKLKTIGSVIGKSKQAVSRDLQHLAECGYIEIAKQWRDDGGRMSNVYKLLYDDPRQHCVDTPSTSEVDTPSTSEVDALTTHINAPSYLSEVDSFDQMQELLETMTGLPAMPNDIDTINECASLGVIRDDIAAALQWRKENKRGAVKTIAQLMGGIRTSYSIRVQGANAAKSSAPPKKEVFAEEW